MKTRMNEKREQFYASICKLLLFIHITINGAKLTQRCFDHNYSLLIVVKLHF